MKLADSKFNRQNQDKILMHDDGEGPIVAYRVQLQKKIDINKSYAERRNQAIAMRILSYALFGQKRYQNLYLTCSLNCFYYALKIANAMYRRVPGLVMVIRFETAHVIEYYAEPYQGKTFGEKKYSKINIKLTKNPSEEDKKQPGYNKALDPKEIQEPLTEVILKREGEGFASSRVKKSKEETTRQNKGSDERANKNKNVQHRERRHQNRNEKEDQNRNKKFRNNRLEQIEDDQFYRRQQRRDREQERSFRNRNRKSSSSSERDRSYEPDYRYQHQSSPYPNRRSNNRQEYRRDYRDHGNENRSSYRGYDTTDYSRANRGYNNNRGYRDNRGYQDNQGYQENHRAKESESHYRRRGRGNNQIRRQNRYSEDSS